MAYYVNISDFQARTNDIDGIIPSDLSAETKLSNGLDLQTMRDNAEQNLRQLLSILGYTNQDPLSALQDLNKRIEEFHTTTANFNGVNLRTKIISPLKGIVINDMQANILNFRQIAAEKQSELGEVFIELVNQVTTGLANRIGVNAEQVLVSDIAAELYAQLNQLTFDFGNGTVSISGSKGGTRIKSEYKELTSAVIQKLKEGIKTSNFTGRVSPSIKQLIAKDPNFTRRLLLLAESRGINVEGIYGKQISPPIFEMTETDDSLNIYFDILTPFLEVMDPSDAKGTKAEKAARAYFEGLKQSNPSKYNEEVDKLCSRATSFFNQFFNGSNLTPARESELQSRFNQAIRDIITNYPAALFVGSNDQGVIGILGEIQGLYYMYSILGDLNPSIDSQTLLQWIGGDTTVGGGIKTGADLIMKISENLGFGIQVKNSMDVTSSTSFSDFVLNRGEVDGGFIKQLSNFGIPTEIVTAIEDVFTMQSFNISYHLQGTVAVSGSPKGPKADIYLNTYSELMSLIERANRYMALAAAMIMRIQYLQGQGFMQNNTLWIIGGSAIVSAVQILDDLINQINGEMRGNIFRSSPSTRLGKDSFTIVDYINGAHTTTQNLKTVLKTSYNFHRTA